MSVVVEPDAQQRANDEVIKAASAVAALKPADGAATSVVDAITDAVSIATVLLTRETILRLSTANRVLKGAGSSDTFVAQTQGEVADVLGRLVAHAAPDDDTNSELKDRLTTDANVGNSMPDVAKNAINRLAQLLEEPG